MNVHINKNIYRKIEHMCLFYESILKQHIYDLQSRTHIFIDEDYCTIFSEFILYIFINCI